MKHTITDDRRQLIITADSNERGELSRQSKTSGIESDEAMTDWFDSLVSNSELEWINPADTGDLTDAPMLGIRGEVMTIEQIEAAAKSKPGIYGSVLYGHWEGKDRHQPILERWVFMDYQVRSVLQDLRDKGQAVFSNGE